MTSQPLPGPSDDPLAALVTSLVARAERDAAETLRLADEAAAATLQEARTQADQILAQARARGAADAAAVLAGERARAEREARGRLLRAQRDAFETLRRAARDEVARIVDDPDYPALCAALSARAEHELGPGAVVTDLPRGGLVAERAGRRVEYGLDGLADDLLDELGAEVAELWAP